MSRLLLALLTGLVAAGTCLPATATAAAERRVPCVPGQPEPTCLVWTGKVAWVDDGDTLDVNVDDDGTKRLLRVRIAGIQAMEQTTYVARARAGDCHSVDATERLEELVRIGRGKVRLTAQDRYTQSRSRDVRSVALRIGGRWRDVGGMLVGEGLALWMPMHTEFAWNRSYSEQSQVAALLNVGIFDGGSCAPGPYAGHPLKLWASWDADGPDIDFPNGEWIRIKNLDQANAIALDGWWVRDSGLRRFKIPPGTVVGPNGVVTVYVGRGTAAGWDFFWGERKPVFENVTRDARAIGDGAYLFDPDGDLRSWMLYPCRIDCSDPLEGAVDVTARPRGTESVAVTNRSQAAFDLQGYVLSSPPWSYAFPAGSVVQPGQTLRILTGGDPAADEPLRKHWGMLDPILDNGGDVVRVKTYTDLQLACHAWGGKSC